MINDPTRRIQLRGVRVHNLKGVDLDLPLDQLVVFSGISGSGKSSLAFDTLYAEGQRRYIETFSNYTRQFLERLDKPDADSIDGIPPAVAVGQRGGRRSGRSTVGSVTELDEALGMLFARAGKTLCFDCGRTVEPASPATVVRAIEALPEGLRYLIAFPLEVGREVDRRALADALRAEGFTRVALGVKGQTFTLDTGPLPLPEDDDGKTDVVVDRLVRGLDTPERRLDSIETAFARGQGKCRVISEAGNLTFFQGWRCSGCGRDYPEPDPRLFRTNSPMGACATCEGCGRVNNLDLSRIVPDPSRSIRDGAIAPWATPAYIGKLQELLRRAAELDIPVDLPFDRLGPEQVRAVIEGKPECGFAGLRGFFRGLESKLYKTHVRVFASRWRSYRPCPACRGARLRPEALSVKVDGLDIATVRRMTVVEARAFLSRYEGSEGANAVVRRILEGVERRLDYLDRIGLGYLTLDRHATTLSGGEAQRVALTAALGSGLVNTLYVLDEPTVGLHPHDVVRLIATLHDLRDAGNSVVVVEHDASVLNAADMVVDIGPGAGALGGHVLYAGPIAGLSHVAESATAEFLSGRRGMAVPTRRRPTDKGFLRLIGARGRNLQGLDVAFPLGVLCLVTGVSGSGKSTLVTETLYPSLRRTIHCEPLPSAPFDSLEGAEALDDVVLIDQAPIGRSARSNPVTYLRAFDEIRKTFAATHEAKQRRYGPSRFSFNVEGGRCNTCEGNGFLTVDMKFLADVIMRCPECHGSRYRPETLEVTYGGRSIAEVLEMTAREALGFFRHRPRVQARLRPLLDVGLEYLRLGQPASTLSGGEAQRLKLATFLGRSPATLTRAASASERSRTLFILDEPTTGLHPADTARLFDALESLLDLGHSLLVIEHSPELMRRADWIIDLGPGAGAEGGRLIAEGTPEDLARAETPTGCVLAESLRSG